jgi:type I restriction enzyme R subunit
VPKTLIFAKDDSHAEDIVKIVREEFGKGNDFCQKITYKVTGAKPADLIQSFRNSYNPHCRHRPDCDRRTSNRSGSSCSCGACIRCCSSR